MSHQFSMPQTTLEMATVEKLLNIPEDSVPCKIRAKRGCATHPRSIAERVSSFCFETGSLAIDWCSKLSHSGCNIHDLRYDIVPRKHN